MKIIYAIIHADYGLIHADLLPLFEEELESKRSYIVKGTYRELMAKYDSDYLREFALANKISTR